MNCGIPDARHGKCGMTKKQKNNFWRNKTVLVTGANGFLGSWICKRLTEGGAQVIGLIRDFLWNSYLQLTGTDKKIHIVRGELEDYFLLERILNEFEIDTCFHLGAQPIVTVANRFPLSTYESNIRGTWNLLEALRCNGNVQRIVIASSDKAYGSKEKMPYTETAALEGANPYDFSKTCTDLMAQMYAKIYQLPIAISRCGNFFGPGDLNFSRIVPGTIRSLLLNENPIIRSDGTYLRDYFYIEDAVDAYLTLAEQIEKTKGEAFNFGNEKPISVRKIVEKIIQISGKKNLKPKILNIAKGEIKVQYLSCKKARKILGWEAKFSLDEALKITYPWYQRFFASLNAPSANHNS